MDGKVSQHGLSERMVPDESPQLLVLPLSLLTTITNDFSADQEIGRGSHSVVYKGILQNGAVAVKMLLDSVDMDEQKFKLQIDGLMRLKHKNIVRFLGYCADAQQQMFNYEGNNLSDRRQRLLCFEYVSGESLKTYITDVYLGLEWTKRYQIIRGICDGLHYLHENGVIHFDLKPSNILLDDNMVPKLCDICYSRFFYENQSPENTKAISGSIAYLAPEFYDGVITFKLDIYALGVIFSEILTGLKGCSSVVNVLEGWRNRLRFSRQDTPLEQIRVCAEICIRCLDANPNKRPQIQRIVEALNETESMMPDTQRVIEMLNDMDESNEIGMGTILAEKASNGVQQDTPSISGVESSEIMELNILERIVAGIEEPSHLDLPLLHRVTENFAEDNRIGTGGCGDVYKGILRNGAVAVKRLFKCRTIKDKIFHREVKSLIKIDHKNIVRLLGYCSVTEERAISFEGRTIMVDIRERLLCFEHISNGSLENYLTDELRGLEWHTRHEIIMGICMGLLYLHKEKNIIHMDLKPANILLDDHMVPKITDFGLARFDNNSQTKTASRLISRGYCAPEYVLEGKSSSKSDIYSLGIIILEMVTGSNKRMIPNTTSKALRRWRHRWIKSSKHTALSYRQVTKCLELAQRCTQHDPIGRPDISDIIYELNEIDSTTDQFQVIPCLEDMLGIEPLEIHFPIEELNQKISLRSSQRQGYFFVINDTSDYFAFMTKTRLRCLYADPEKGIVPPGSKCSVTITMMQAQVMPLLNNNCEITVQSTRVDGCLDAGNISGDMFFDEEGKVVDEVNVMVVLAKPPLAEEP